MQTISSWRNFEVMQWLKSSSLSKIIAIGIVGLQVFDIVIHVATNQIELMRIVSNFVVMTWVGALLLGRSPRNFRLVGYGALTVYALLNILFVAIHGLTNPNQGDALRIVLFILVFFTLGLSILTIHLSRK